MTHPPRPPLALLALTLLTACPPHLTEGSVDFTTTTTSSTDPDPTSTTTTTSDDPGPDPTTTTTTTTDATSTTTTPESTGEPPPPACGDGILDPDSETCDDGYGLNSDSAACSLHCQLNICGDGLLHLGVEDCDQGLNNNDSPDNYGGCGTDCQPTSYCGDAKIQAAEECDLGASNGSGDIEIDGVACDDTCRFAAKLCFLTSAVYDATNLLSAAKSDQICRTAAFAAGYDNAPAFRAWVSDDASSPATRFTPSQIPYVLPNGRRVANDSKQLLGLGPITGITRTDQGETLIEALVWTATAPDGTLFDPVLDCQDWTSKVFADSARVGRSGVDEENSDEFNAWKYQNHWTSYKTVHCAHKYHLYCFEN